VTEEMKMKNRFLVLAVTILALVVTTGQTQVNDEWNDEWEVTVKGGHMAEKGNTFIIKANGGNDRRLLPGETLRKAWGQSDDFAVDLEEVDLGNGGAVVTALCGFFDVVTDEHEVTSMPGNRRESPFGHGARHGILMIRTGKREVEDQNGNIREIKKLKIIWSARPLKPGHTGNCRKLDELDHGGMAHAEA
jgi:hypothetical protein